MESGIVESNPSEYVPLKRIDHAIVIESMKTNEGAHCVAFTAPKICGGKKCPISNRCNHRKKKSVCEVHRQYLSSIFDAAIDMLGVGITTREAVRLGMHIIPLYSILFDLKLAQVAITSNVYLVGKDGFLKINPIYKEIREQIRLIDNMWTRLGHKELIGHGNSSDDYCSNMFVEG